jgi:hypothetical protein
VSTLGLLFLALAAPLATEPLDRVLDEPSAAVEPDAPVEPDPSIGVPEPALPPPVTEPQHDALEHLARAQERDAAGELEAAEAEAATAISLAPDEAPPYLVRAQIRMKLADRFAGDDPADQRARATLLRLAAQDVGAYVEHAELASDGVAWYRARQDALLREAEALDPPVVVRPEPEPAPIPVKRSKRRAALDIEPWQRTGALVGTGAVAAGAAVGLAATSLAIRQSCDVDGYCRAHWQVRPPFLAPAAVLATLGTTSIAIGLARAPALERRGPRRAVIASGFALGATAAVLGTITAALAGARWSAPASPSNDASLGVTQALGNASAAGFTAAVPLLTAGVTAWVRGRLARPSSRVALRGRGR